MTEFRNPKYSREDGTAIDVEINHETLGWIPYTLLQTGTDAEMFEEAAKTATPYVAPVTVEATPESISDRQFFQQLAVEGLITRQEAIQAVKTGELPQVFATFIASLPEDGQFAAEMALSGATTFNRSNPLVAAFAAAQGIDSATVDSIWRAAFKL